MTLRRWIADEVQGDRALLLGDNARHLAQVLRAKVGQRFEIASDDSVRMGTVTRVQDDQVEFSLGERLNEGPAAASPVYLLQAVFKFDRMEWAIEKATELGVARIVPVIAARSEKHLAQAAVNRVERWRKIGREAAQQSRRSSAPEIETPLKLKQALELVPAASRRFLLSEQERAQSLAAALRQTPQQDAVWLACGPEGGWTLEEEGIFQTAGWQSVSLGPTILRAETAAIAALAIVTLTSWS